VPRPYCRCHHYSAIAVNVGNWSPTDDSGGSDRKTKVEKKKKTGKQGEEANKKKVVPPLSRHAEQTSHFFEEGL